jgi:hypothetical protein
MERIKNVSLQYKQFFGNVAGAHLIYKSSIIICKLVIVFLLINFFFYCILCSINIFFDFDFQFIDIAYAEEKDQDETTATRELLLGMWEYMQKHPVKTVLILFLFYKGIVHREYIQGVVDNFVRHD